MRIAFYAPLKSPDHPVPSGDRRVARLLLSAMRAAGHDVRVASRLRAYDDRGDGLRQDQIKNRGAGLAARYLRRHGANPPDLWFTYHLYHKAPDWLGPAVSDAFAIPYIVAEASVAPKQANGPWAEGHAAVCAAVRQAARIVVLNPDDRECLTPLVGDSNTLVTLVPFLDTRTPRAAAAKRHIHRARLAARFGLRVDSLWITVTAMMRDGDKLKSYRLLAGAKRQMRDLPLTWLVAGDGPVRSEVENALGSQNVLYLGALGRDAIDALHAAADIAVWPALREAFGMALLEAQATGLPVVAGASPGVAQIVDDGETGLLTPVGDETMLAHAVRRLVKDPALRARMRIAAMRKSERAHDLDAAARHIDRVLRDAREALAA